MKNKKHRVFTLLVCVFAILFALIVKLLPAYYLKKGIFSFNKKDYVNAYLSLDRANFWSPSDKDCRYYLVKTMANLQPTEEIQRRMFEMATDNKPDSAQQLALHTIGNWRNYLQKEFNDNYIEQAPYDRGILRWNPATFPLKVVIDTNNNAPDYYKTEITKALAQWQTSVKFITFKITDTPDKADIIIKIQSSPKDLCTENGCRYILGHTTPSIKNSILEKMTITLYNVDPNGNFFSDKEIYNTALHEMGHALGIMGHSFSADDLMYMSENINDNSLYIPYRSSFQYLSSKDINTIKLLYKLIPNITNTESDKLNKSGLVYAPIILGTSKEITNRKLIEAKNYIKNAPNLAGGYSDLAIAYAELDNFKEAAKAFEKALSLAKFDAEQYTILFNIASLNVNNNKLENALNYANKAKAINNTDEINELIANINHAMKTREKAFGSDLLKK